MFANCWGTILAEIVKMTKVLLKHIFGAIPDAIQKMKSIVMTSIEKNKDSDSGLLLHKSLKCSVLVFDTLA